MRTLAEYLCRGVSHSNRSIWRQWVGGGFGFGFALGFGLGNGLSFDFGNSSGSGVGNGIGSGLGSNCSRALEVRRIR